MQSVFSRVLSSFSTAHKFVDSNSVLKACLIRSRWCSSSVIPPSDFIPDESNNRRSFKSMDFVREIVAESGLRGGEDGSLDTTDFVHINIKRNNTFVAITDSKGNKKFGASMGCVNELKGGQKMSRYATEATAEYAGRAGRTLGLNSVVVRVKGFAYFRKKRQAIMSFREGFGDRNPIVFIEDTTRKPHNGCRLPKKRRI